MSPPAGALPYGSLFRYSTLHERGVIVMGCLAAAVTGAMTPVFALMFGRLLNAFFAANLEAEVNKFALIILGVAGAALLSGTLQYSCLMWAGTQQANRVRHLYLASLLSQDMAFFDTATSNADLLHGLREEALAYQEAVSDKLGSFLQGLACFVGALIVSFIRGWDMALVVLASIPALVIVGAICGVFTARLQAKASKAYSRAGGIAGEAVANHLTVAAYGQEEAVVKSYASALSMPTKVGEKQGLLAGFTLGATHLVFFGAYALALWYGSRRVADGEMDGGKVWTIILSCVLGGFSLGGAMPHLAVFQRGCVAAASLFAVIERKSAQAAPLASAPVTVTFTSSQPGEAGPKQASKTMVVYAEAEGQLAPPDSCHGDLELSNVTFAYPARPDRPVFQSLSLVFPAGKTTALVGESGSGKSTIIQLLLRLYDPASGAVMLDGRDVQSLPISWLRAQFGLVSQTPTLFASSILDNIALDSGAGMEAVVAAAMAANAHGFISKLPNGYDTVVGERGSNLSGGQKQRIAIARAILRSPQVLLLDEATSALDSGCEKAVQSALEALTPGRTCITVAHRLSTVAAADAIHVLKGGAVVESGTHRQLMERGGYYTSLASKQAMRLEEEAEVHGPEQGGAAAGGDAMVTVTPGRAKAGPRKMRDSVLRRGSVRLSIIPQGLKDKLAPRRSQEGGEAPPVAFSRLAAMNRPEWRFGVLGLLCATAAGLQMPGFSLALSEVLSGLYLPNPDDVRSEGQKWALVFVGVGVGALLVETVEGWCFGVMGQRLATRLRTLVLKSLLRQEAAFFDRPENASGALMSTLAGDAASVRGAVGDRLGVLFTMLSCIVASFTIAFYNSWSVTLVVTAALPVLIASNGLLAKLAFGAQAIDREALSHANAMATEALGAIKTVAAFNMQPSYVRLYQKELQRSAPAWSALLAGLGFGCSQFFLLGVTSLGFWFGGTQVGAGKLGFKEMLTANMAVFYAAFGLAQAQTAFPDLAKAAEAVRRTFRILDRQPAIDPAAGATVELEGGVELKRVTFAYPSRPGRLILKDFNLAVPAGTSCALVGESGHGKSTIIGLLERFYEPQEGQVLIDGINIASLHLGGLRRQIALVGQEPVVFSASILDNITLGSGASMQQVQAAAKAAHALEFIEALPEGFATRLGDGGSQLSGGQLQRLAVARAMLRAPRILLLDEPTSALDSESERMVQAALEALLVGRTTIVVAHRLSTVVACTRIAAIYRGRVLEQGTHAELLAKPTGYYRHLWDASQA